MAWAPPPLPKCRVPTFLEILKNCLFQASQGNLREIAVHLREIWKMPKCQETFLAGADFSAVVQFLVQVLCSEFPAIRSAWWKYHKLKK